MPSHHYLVFISNGLVDVDGVLFQAIVGPTVLPITLLRASVGEPEELGVRRVPAQGDHLLEGWVIPGGTFT